MESEILKYGLQYGIFGVLFIWLFFDTRKDTKAREKQYQDTIDKNQEIISKSQDTIKENQDVIAKLTDKFNIVEKIKDDIKDIKDQIFK